MKQAPTLQSERARILRTLQYGCMLASSCLFVGEWQALYTYFVTRDVDNSKFILQFASNRLYFGANPKNDTSTCFIFHDFILIIYSCQWNISHEIVNQLLCGQCREFVTEIVLHDKHGVLCLLVKHGQLCLYHPDYVSKGNSRACV